MVVATMKLRLLGVNVLKRWDADGKLPVAASSATALDPTPNSSLIFKQVRDCDVIT